MVFHGVITNRFVFDVLEMAIGLNHGITGSSMI